MGKVNSFPLWESDFLTLYLMIKKMA